MENNFFSIITQSNWQNGQSDNIENKNSGIQIASSIGYIYEKTIKLDIVGMNNTIKACTVGENEIIYYLDNEFRIRMYDTDTQITAVISDKKYEDMKLKIQSSAGKIYVCYHADSSAVVDIISAETGMLEDKIEFSDDEKTEVLGFNVDLTATAYILCSSGVLYCINRKLNIKDRYNLSKTLNRVFAEYVESGIIIKGYKAENAYFYDKNKSEFIHINLSDNTFDTVKIENISSIGVYKDYILINREENIKSTAYFYDTKNKSIEKLSFLTGKSDDIEFDRHGKIYIHNFEKNLLTVMSEKAGINYNTLENAYMGTYYTKIFDSDRNGVLWDKIAVESKIPSGCMMMLSYYAYDEHEVFYEGRQYKLSDFIADKNIALIKKEQFMKNRWQKNITNFKKALFRNAAGRYMIIKIELWGTNINTPSIDKMRIYYDRKDYTQYLPEIYSAENNDSFLGRYLSLFESFLQDIEEKIDFISDNFDADNASSEMLRWLCGWLDIEIDLTWSDYKIRKLIKRAPYIFKRRGTKASTAEILEIYLGEKPVIIENFQLDFMRQNSETAGLTKLLYGNNIYGFTVIVKMSRELSEDEKAAVKKILDNETPAYCTYKFIVLEPWMALDKHTYLGINSQILNWSSLRLDGKSILPYNAILTNRQITNK